MTTRLVSVRELKELDPKRYEREYDRWVQDLNGWEWWECVIDTFCEEAKAKGLSVESTDISWSLSYSQGDGLAFGAGVHVGEWMKDKGHDEKYPALYLYACKYHPAVHIERNSRYNSMVLGHVDDIDYSEGLGMFEGLDRCTFTDLVMEQYDELDVPKAVFEDCYALANEWFRRLRDEYEYQTSEERFIESMEDNDTTFTLEDEE